MHRSKQRKWIHELRCLLSLTAFLVFGTGCLPSNDTKHASEDGKAPNPSSSPIHVIVVDDEPLAATIRRQWEAAAEGAIQVENVVSSTVSELQTKRLSADVLIYPSSWLGELVEERMLIPVSSRARNDSQYDRSEILPLDQTAAVTWGERTYAFSFGVPQFVLMYRQDVLERMQLVPPRTWVEYQQICDRLAEQDIPMACVEPLAPGWAAYALLARAASYAREPSRYWTLFDFENMEPMIATPPFERALSELVKAAAIIPENERAGLTPAQARDNVIAGRSIIAVTWPTAGDQGDGSADAETAIGFARLPGARNRYNLSGKVWIENSENDIRRVPLFGIDGRLGSVLTTSAYPRHAFNFLAWLTGKQRSAAICSASQHTAPFRQSHVSRARLWVGATVPAASSEAYFDAAAAAKSESLWLGGIRIPGREDYLSALDQAVSDALHGKDAASALAAAAERWRETTKRLGIARQRAAYLKSLGLEPSPS